MDGSLRALLDGLIDYAGLFPPASLPLDHAVARYLNDRESDERWMLGRFICPATRLAELERLVPAASTPLRISALAGGGDTIESFLASLDVDRVAIEAFHRAGAGWVESIEIKLPPALLSIDDRGPLRECVTRARDLGASLKALPELYVEGMTSTAALSALLETLGAHGEVGFKVRTGGVTADAVPSGEFLAAVLAGVTARGLRWKATAGLHHPIRRFDRGVGTKMHGFLNLFLAGALLGAGKIDQTGAVHLLLEEDASAFHFSADHAGWREAEISSAEVAQQRRTARSFGSCSFDEPREDLRALGLLTDQT